ncbi:MAG: hypothetical protein NC213_05675 [Acetobacter sp.]|nr:hypothetical protein [Bacteroides sp.]MCM1341217.1 hypothetical protein [Acetobacter sp.]MCM1433860.1 hypothetical protein [Clostridiales bacterium]
MELNEIFRLVEKQLSSVNEELHFNKADESEDSITFTGNKGSYKISYNAESTVMEFSCAYGEISKETEFGVISKSLFDAEAYDERDVKSFANEVADEITSLFKSKKKVDIDKVKMPKAVSRTKAKNGVISYDADSLANRFGTMFPEMKDLIKQNIIDYGEFLPETFFTEHGTARVLEVIADGTETERKKLFKMLNEIYEDGTNEVQDIIGVTILGEMKNDKAMMEIADKYMSEYMAGPVHEINKITRKNNSLTKKLKNPPPYKPKKKKNNLSQRMLDANNLNNR